MSTTAHTVMSRGLDVKAIRKTVAFKFSEQAQAWRRLDHLGAHEGGAVTDKKNVEIRSESGQFRLGPRVAGRRCPVLGVHRECPVGEVRDRFQAREIDLGDIALAHLLITGEPHPDTTELGQLQAAGHLIATEPSSRKAVRERSAATGGCIARPASSSSMPSPGPSGAIR